MQLIDDYTNRLNSSFNRRMNTEYDRIISKLTGARMYGKDIDMSNSRDLIVAAYWCGFMECKPEGYVGILNPRIAENNEPTG